MDRVKRIQKMEEKLDTAAAAVQGLAAALKAYRQAPLGELFAYYFGPRWKEDYAADERGELPPGLKRGVLSEDAVYNLFSDNQALLEELQQFLQEKQEP